MRDKPKFVRPVRLTPTQLAAADWVESLRRERLERLRGVASQWAESLATAASLLGAGALFNADATVRSLPTSWRILFAVATALAATFAAIAVMASSSAARHKVLDLPVDVEAQVGLYESSVSRVLKLLTWSRYAAIAGVMFLAVTFVIRWFAPATA